MSAYEIARDLSLLVLIHVGATTLVSHMNVLLKSKTITTVATGVQSNTVVYETPYVWAREFLEESGFNLTERIPAIIGVYEIPGVDYRQHFPTTRVVSAVPPYLLHEPSLRWTFILIGNFFQSLVNTICAMAVADFAWLSFLALVIAMLYHWRHHVVVVLSGFWQELHEDVAAFVQQHFFPDTITLTAAELRKAITAALAKKNVDPAPNELPADAIILSAADMDLLKTSADAIQKRINYLRMSKTNFVRGCTGVVFNLNTFRQLRTRLAKAQEALKQERVAKAKRMVKVFCKLQKQITGVRKALREEKASHQRTQDSLDHEINARANAEEQLESLRARSEAKEREDEHRQQTIEEAEEGSPAVNDMSSQLSIENSKESKEEAPADQVDSQPDLEEENPGSSTQPEGIAKPEEESAVDVIDTEVDRAAEHEDKADKARIKRLQIQLKVEQTSYRHVFRKKQIFRHGALRLKKELEDLQAGYNALEVSRDTWRATCEATEEQSDVRAVRALRDQHVSDNAHNERRIDALNTQLGIEKTSREEAQQIARELRESSKNLEDELVEAHTKYENLQIAYGELDGIHGAEERANEDKEQQITEMNAELNRLKAAFATLNERYAQLNAARSGVAETSEGPSEDVKNDKDSPDNGRNADAVKVAPNADLASQGDVANLPCSSEDTPSEEPSVDNGQQPVDLPTSAPSPPRAASTMNGSAPIFVPSVRPKPPGPPILPRHQAYIVSQPGASSSSPGSSSGSPRPDLLIPSAAKPEVPSPEASVQGAIHAQDPFPKTSNGTVPQYNGLPEHAPAFKAPGLAEAKNEHVQKLNEEIKRREWTRKSGKPDLVEDREGVAAPDNVLDGMYDRQITQFLYPTPIRFARGSMWGSLNDVPNPLDNENWSDIVDNEHPEGDDGAPMLGKYKVTRGHEKAQDNGDTPMLGHHKVPLGPTPTRDNSTKAMRGSTKRCSSVAPTNGQAGTPKDKDMSGADGDWTDVEDEEKQKDEEDGKDVKDKQESVTVPLPVPQSQPPAPNPSPSPAGATDESSPTGQGNTSDGPNTEAARNGKTPNRRPSNLFPGAANATRTHSEDVGDAFTDYFREHGTKKLSDSMWATKPDAKVQPLPQASSPAAQGHTSDGLSSEVARGGKFAHQRPSNLFPGAANATRTHSEDVGDAFTDYVREHGTKKLSDSMWATKPDARLQASPQQGSSAPTKGVPSSQTPNPLDNGSGTRARPRGPPNFSDLPNPQPPPGAPTGPRALNLTNFGPRRSENGYQTSAELDQLETVPKVRLPSPPKASQAQPAPVIPETVPFTQWGLDDDPKFRTAPFGIRETRGFNPPYRGSPLRNEIVSPFQTKNSSTQPRTAPWPAGKVIGCNSSSPRDKERGSSGRQQGDLSPPKQNSTEDTPKATPAEPEAEHDLKILGAGSKGHGAGLGVQQAQDAPAQTPQAKEHKADSTPDAPRAAPAGPTATTTPTLNHNDKNNTGDQTPPRDRRNGHGGRAMGTPQRGPGRASGAGNSASSSFKRWQEALAKEARNNEQD